jgi:hypothetical protein
MHAMQIPLLQSSSRFPKPDWDTLYKMASSKTYTHMELDAFWNQAALKWLEMLGGALGDGYQIYESTHYLVLGRQPASICEKILQWLEQIKQNLDRMLGDTACQDFHGKLPVLMFDGLDAYYEYYASCVEDGDHPLSGGCYINDGYGHFIFPYMNRDDAERAAAHELTHAFLSAYPIPLWLNEGMAQLFEAGATGGVAVDVHEMRATMRSYWNAETIREFWSGSGFQRQDKGQSHCYYLAMILARELSFDMPDLRKFIREAHWNDAGEAAMRRIFGFSLGELAADFLGDGDWGPHGKDEAPVLKITTY